MRYPLVDISRPSTERVGGLAVVKWNDVTSPFEGVDGQDRAKDQFCVRLASIWFSQLAWKGR
jgi:hypothetical protein